MHLTLCSTTGSLLHFSFQKFSTCWGTVRTAGQPVRNSESSTFVMCRRWFCIVLLKNAWTSLEKMWSWRPQTSGTLTSLSRIWSLSPEVLSLCRTVNAWKSSASAYYGMSRDKNKPPMGQKSGHNLSHFTIYNKKRSVRGNNITFFWKVTLSLSHFLYKPLGSFFHF